MTDTSQSERSGPLTDLRVVEMGQLLAGPFCGQLMADFGAEVIKIEQPGTGDPMRQWGREKPHGKSLWWPVVARNKKSVEINAREPEGQALIRDLLRGSDVLIENFRPGTMERWGLGPDALSEINPRLVVIRVSGYGQNGPYAKRAGYGAIGEAMGGLRYVVGDPSTPPSRMGISIGDTLAATFACLGGLMALHEVARTVGVADQPCGVSAQRAYTAWRNSASTWASWRRTASARRRLVAPPTGVGRFSGRQATSSRSSASCEATQSSRVPSAAQDRVSLRST